MARFTPLTKNFWQLGCGYYSSIKTADNKVVGSSIGDLHFLIPFDPVIKLDELVSQLAYGTGSQLMQVSLCPFCVLPADHDSLGTRKGQILTDYNPRAGHKAGWECLVMGITNTNDP